MRRLFKNATILTMTGEEPLRNASLVVAGAEIFYVGTEPPEGRYDETVDLSGKLLMPGLINTHGHAAMCLLRGYGSDLPLQTWLEEKMWPMEARFGAEQVRWGTALAVVEMLKGGTTLFADMYDHMDEVARVVEESGIRASLCRGVIGLGPEEERREKLAESVRFAEEWSGAADGRITTMLGPHAPYTCPPDFLGEFVAASERTGAPVHIHLSETAFEVEQNVRDYGARPVEHLDKLGLLDRPTLVAHAVHLTDAEIELLAERDVKVSHNPGSNLKLGSGIARVPEMLRAGMRPSLGTDSAASNNNLDLLEEIRLAALIHKGNTLDPLAVSASEALRMGTLYGAEAVFLAQKVGTLEAGKLADFIVLDLSAAHLQPQERINDVISHVAYSAVHSDVLDVYVDGEPVVRDGVCTRLDEEKVVARANEALAKILG
ncbi:Cytosine deaminase and related metal-dependent hydrolase [Rubrobacter radiotolerans]|uniref:5-methylthioadenosine/S-adenosylhomocysteine deaminase n=2 Tax=Rubrobacter radiotolerans TaxID=42256 RepID=A0A023X734_RUBRA|nr:amidohydrolase [Rubrobacter radiotolerans]AHY48011.1 Cytosine deaminase and related metal-dependent hydrolase [Rubrobacter radiotolerans]MDX5892650.1 amidohydrolase [Rubrobacter radiotolerans]SMC08021.1 5-methylthioadenosine/S-adenosylhomocysteine deaminase [Rubrobacter radiotolerans DSM 5868]